MSDMNNLHDLNELTHPDLGTSMFELIEFSLVRTIDGQKIKGNYGINVAKVREVVRMMKINCLATSIPGISGIFELRGVPIPAVNLALILGDEEAEIHENQQIIVAEFSHKRAGFIVDEAHRIRRVAWPKVMPPADDAGSCINGMTLIEDNEFLFILDLERILMDLESISLQQRPRAMGDNLNSPPPAPAKIETTASPGVLMDSLIDTGEPQLAANAPTVLLVDDSMLILNSVKSALQRTGYHVTIANNGAEAWQLLEDLAEVGDATSIDVIVTDVEMPRMDGLTLTGKIRAHQDYSDIPVILHSSLSGKATQDAGMGVGANGYVIKNDTRMLCALLTEILGDRAPS